MDRRQVFAGAAGVAASAVIGAQRPASAQTAGIRPFPGAAADFKVRAAQCAFINVDMQNCFVEGRAAAPDGLALLARLNRFAEFCRAQGVLVIHTAHVLRPDLSNAGLMPQYLAQIREGMITRGSESARLHRDLVVDSSDIVLEKPRFGAFQGSDLESILRTRGIDSVIIGGIATNVCCETTAREASARDFRMFFLHDGTATFPVGDLPASHFQDATCTIMQFFGEVLGISQMRSKLSV
jgi:nicotinamidase-related amidase